MNSFTLGLLEIALNPFFFWFCFISVPNTNLFLQSAIPNTLIDSHLDCKLTSGAASPRSVAVVKNQPPTPTSPSCASDPVGTMSELVSAAGDANGKCVNASNSPESAAGLNAVSSPSTSTAYVATSLVEHNPPVSTDHTTKAESSTNETENNKISGSNETKIETNDVSIKSEAQEESCNDIKREPKSEPRSELESEPELESGSEPLEGRASSVEPNTTSKHKRMLSTVTEDREIKRPVHIVTSVPEPSRAVLAQNAAAAAIARGSSANDQDQQAKSPPRKSPGLPVSPFKATEPPIALLSSSTISSTSSSNRRHAHILSEQRRRENINGGFQLLKNSVPFCKGTQDSKAMILKKAVEYIMSLEQELAQLRYHEGMAHQPPPPQHSPISQMAPSHHAHHYGHPQSAGLPPLAMDPRYAPSYGSHVPSLPPPHLPPTATSPGVSPQHHHHAPPPASSPNSLPPPTPVHSMSSPISSRTPGPIHHGVGHLHHAPPPPPHYATGTGYPPPISRPTSTPPFNSHSVFNSRRSHPLPTADDPGSRYPDLGRH